MDLSYYLAQVMGLYFFIIGVAMLLNPPKFKAIMSDFQENPALLTYTGIVGLVMGLLLVVGHNYWMGWPTVITILSWIILLKALFRILFLDQFIQFTQRLMHKQGYNWMCWISIIVGAYLAIMGFFM